MLHAPRADSFDSRKPSYGMRARRSIYAGHGASSRTYWVDPRTSSGSNREIGSVRRLRATSSASFCRLADVPRQCADELCGPARRCDDRKRARYLADRSATGLRSVLAAFTQARQGGSCGMVGTNIPRRPRWNHDHRLAGKLRSVHWGPRGHQDPSTRSLLDHQARSYLSGSARKRHTSTTIWEEWVIWRLSSRPDGKGFFASVLRTNLYVAVLVMAAPAILILPKRLNSPDFLAKHSITVTNAPSH